MISREGLVARFNYETATGIFTYKRSVGRAKKGSVAGHLHHRGYVHIIIGGLYYKAHRLAWLYVHGEWPSAQIDHIDGNRANNAIGNLRLCSQAQNNANSQKRSINTSGYKGVSWHRRAHKWSAQIKIDGRQKHLGYFSDKLQAAAAYERALISNFGVFARVE